MFSLFDPPASFVTYNGSRIVAFLHAVVWVVAFGTAWAYWEMELRSKELADKTIGKNMETILLFYCIFLTVVVVAAVLKLSLDVMPLNTRAFDAVAVGIVLAVVSIGNEGLQLATKFDGVALFVVSHTCSCVGAAMVAVFQAVAMLSKNY